MLLDFQRQMVAELAADDAGLLVVAKGLDVRGVLAALLQIYAADEAGLVFLLNTPAEEEELLVESVALQGVHRLPKIVNAEVPSAIRCEVYASGGVVSITSRILIVDMLADRVPFDRISGILVHHAHRISEMSIEAFILNIYRDHNKTGFLKALTDDARELSVGFNKLEKIMRTLFVKHVHLWPRFHVDVSSCFDRHPVDVVECSQKMSRSMTKIQSLLLEIIEACLRELKESNPAVEFSDLTMENALVKSFDYTIRLQLDPVWHRLSPKTKQLVADLSTLRSLLKYLVQYDCVTFFTFLQTLLMTYHTTNRSMTWLLTDVANTLFVAAEQRVYRKQTTTESATGSDEAAPPSAKRIRRPTIDTVTPVLEENPKWALLEEILREIDESEKKSPENERGGVMVVAGDERICTQLREYMTLGGKEMLQRGLKKHFEFLEELPRIGASMTPTSTATLSRNSSSSGSGSGSSSSSSSAPTTPQTGSSRKAPALSASSRRPKSRNAPVEISVLADFLSQFDQYSGSSAASVASPASLEASEESKELDSLAEEGQREAKDGAEEGEEEVAASEPIRFNKNFAVLSFPIVMFQALSNLKNSNILHEFQPKYVILYDHDIGFIRQLEVYRASSPGMAVRAYFLMYDESVEEQQYLTAIQREKKAFETLIRQKSAMAYVQDQDGKSTSIRLREEVVETSTRRAGGRKMLKARSNVVVDAREFRHNLPFLIYLRGMDVKPITLEVGDFVLSPDICVERKSIVDLIQSLHSGRLYTQVEAMCLHYKLPTLLIEFEQGKSFSLQSVTDIPDEISINSVSSKLVLLTLHFPALRIIWSPNPYTTAEIFEQLKREHDEPNAEVAAGLESDSATRGELEYNVTPREVLSHLPGITSKNYFFVLRHVEDLRTLSDMTEQEIADLIGDRPAKELRTFLLRSTKNKITSGSAR